MTDIELLQKYGRERSEEAFATLVSRYSDSVYSIAVRQVGNRQLAEEIAQAVFLILAQKWQSLPERTILSGWLFRTTRFVANNAVKGEVRRAKREQLASLTVHNESESAAECWQRVAPELDSCLEDLSEEDHLAVLLRFFDHKSLAEVGAALAISEDAARKRIGRVLERLKQLLRKRQIIVPGGALSALLYSHAVEAAPVSLAPLIAGSVAKAGAGSLGTLGTLGTSKGLITAMAWTKTQTAILATAAIGIALTIGTVAFHGSHFRQDESLPRSVLAKQTNRATQTPRSLAMVGFSIAEFRSRLAAVLKIAGFSQRLSSLTELARMVPREFIEEALAMRFEIPPGLLRETYRNLLLQAWAQFDPANAVRWAERTDSAPERLSAVACVVQSWLKTDLRSLETWARAIHDEQEQRSVFAQLLPEFTAQNPEAALALARTVRGHLFRGRMVSVCFLEWARLDPSAAAGAYSSLDSDERKEVARSGVPQDIARKWAATDLNASIGWAKTLPDSADREASFSGLIGEWSKWDPAGATKFAMDLPSAIVQKNVAVEAAVAWANSDLTAALNWVRALPDGVTKQSLLRELTPVWIWSDAKGAAAYAASMAPGEGQAKVLEKAVAAWATDNPGESLDWSQNLPPGEARTRAMQTLFATWSEADPKDALSQLGGITDLAERQLAANTIAARWGQTDPQVGAQEVSKLADESVRGQAITKLATEWARQNPTDAADFVATLEPGKAQADAAKVVVLMWAKSDPKAAADWVLQFPEDTIPEAVQYLMFSWTEKDPATAERWLRNLPPGATRDMAIVQFASQIKDFNAPGARAWIEQITDAKLRSSQNQPIASLPGKN